jgi:hypothetical protein
VGGRNETTGDTSYVKYIFGRKEISYFHEFIFGDGEYLPVVSQVQFYRAEVSAINP